MIEIEALAETCAQDLGAGLPVALATVVGLKGSGYRRPGARMLVRANGERIGSISGGCLETDVAERGRRVMQTGRPELAYYDGRGEIDPVAELGCKGEIQILIEPVSGETVRSLEFIGSFRRYRGRGAIATVFDVRGGPALRPGDRLFRYAGGVLRGELSSSPVREMLLRDLDAAAEDGVTASTRIRVPELDIDAGVLFEPVVSPISVIICGAGHDAVPLAKMAAGLGWCVSVVDHRHSLLCAARFPCGTVMMPYHERDRLIIDERTAAVIMTHSYRHDVEWVGFLLEGGSRYVGLLGPRKRAAELIAEICATGFDLSRERQKHLHAPVGLDLGAETADEIALSILAEIQAEFNGRTGGRLCDRSGAIHSTPVES